MTNEEMQFGEADRKGARVYTTRHGSIWYTYAIDDGEEVTSFYLLHPVYTYILSIPTFLSHLRLSHALLPHL
jgi:hypothetical protein